MTKAYTMGKEAEIIFEDQSQDNHDNAGSQKDITDEPSATVSHVHLLSTAGEKRTAIGLFFFFIVLSTLSAMMIMANLNIGEAGNPVVFEFLHVSNNGFILNLICAL